MSWTKEKTREMTKWQVSSCTAERMLRWKNRDHLRMVRGLEIATAVSMAVSKPAAHLRAAEGVKQVKDSEASMIDGIRRLQAISEALTQTFALSSG